MEFKFSKGGEESVQAEPAAEKKNQTAILVLLLLLVGGFSYVYFFTGIIKPQEAAKPAAAPVAAQIVKMPLPQPDGNAGKEDVKPADAKKEAIVPPKTELPKAPVAPAAAVAQGAKAPAQQPVKPNEEPKKVEAVKPKEAVKKAEPPKASEKPPAVADKKTETAKADIKKATVAVSAKSKTLPVKTEKPVKANAVSSGEVGPRSILVGTYVLEDALSTDMGHIRKAGFEPVVKPGARKKTAMNRLFLAEFTERSAAQDALDKLRHQTSDAFVVDQAGKYSVYAGSYLLDARAASEMKRLNASGFPVSLKRVEVAIPTQTLTVGPFKDKKSADVALGKLKAAGVKAAILQK